MENKGKEIFGLGKLPDSVLLKQSRLEVGMLTSERDEYKDELESLQKKVNSSELKDVINLRKEVKKLQDSLEQKNNRITNLEEKRDELNNDLVKKNRIIDSLQKDCVRLLKEKS